MSLQSLRAQLNEAIRQRDINKAKIRRLKSAKTMVQSSKNQLSSRRNQLKTKANSQDTYGEWVGETQKEAKAFLTDDVIGEYNYYINRVDARLDDICDEITRLENEVSRLNGLIGYLQAAINSLLNELEKATN